MRWLFAVLSGVLTLAVAAPAAADAPTEIPFEDVFVDVNPCTGLDHTVTITGTIFEHSHDGRVNGHTQRTITTDPTGFVGHGTDSLVDNGRVFRFTLNDVLMSPSGDRIRVQLVLVVDLSTDTVRVEKRMFACFGPA
jgi:hypothetical protein